jgi:hypothetical protein
VGLAFVIAKLPRHHDVQMTTTYLLISLQDSNNLIIFILCGYPVRNRLGFNATTRILHLAEAK